MLNRTNLFNRLKKYDPKFIDFNGWDMPISFEGTLKEHMTVRENAGFFDVSHMGRFNIPTDNLPILNTIICGDLTKKSNNTAMYSMILNQDGGIIDDVIIWKFTNFLILICNASNTEAVTECLTQKNLVFQNINMNTSLIAIQGPEVIRKLENSFEIPLSFECNEQFSIIFSNKIIIARTGYTGEDGIEILISHNDDIKLMDILDEKLIKPCGLGARDTLRLEASLPLYGQELNESITPIEAGFEWVVDFDHVFSGKEKLISQMSSGDHKYLRKFVINERIIARHGDVVVSQDTHGVVTSGNYSPILKKSIGFVMFQSKPDLDIIKLKIRNKLIDGKLIKGKFIG